MQVALITRFIILGINCIALIIALLNDAPVLAGHSTLDGKHFKRKDAEVGFNLPPMHPNCRCSIAPYEDEANFEANSGTINLAKNSARIQSVDWERMSSKTDITHEEVMEELKKSAVGRETIKIINESDDLKISYIQGRSHGDRRRGEQSEDKINIYLDCTRNVTVTAQTVIHEVTHYYYGIEQCQWAEAVCFAREKMHLVDRKLTYAERRKIIKLTKANYPEFRWKKGGRRNGKKI